MTGVRNKIADVRHLLAEIRWESEILAQKRIAELIDRSKTVERELASMYCRARRAKCSR